MGFHKAIGGRLRAGNKAGHAGFGAAQGSRARRWPGTIPTAYWRVEGAADDSTTLLDVSKAGHGLNGTLAGTVNEDAGDTKTWNTANVPPGSIQSLYFNGTNNVITVAYDSELKPSSVNKLSITMWVKTEDTDGYMLSAEDADGTAGWVYVAVGVPSAGADKPATVFFYSGTSANWRTGGSAVANDDEWHHLAFVYNEDATNSVVIYQDGIAVGSNDDQTGGWSSSSNNNVTIQIGARTNVSKWYQYYLDEIAYFTDVGLTAAQVKDMYNEGRVVNSYAGIQRG